MRSLLGLALAFLLGVACRWFKIPVPSPPKLLGALLVVATTIGYMAADNYLAKAEERASTPARLSGDATSPAPFGR